MSCGGDLSERVSHERIIKTAYKRETSVEFQNHSDQDTVDKTHTREPESK